MGTYSYPELPLQGPYGTMYPQDQLSQIKMRNRRFMNACAMEMGQGMGMQPYGQPMMPMGMMGPQQPMMMGPMGPQPMMMGPPPMMDAEMATVEQLPLPKKTVRSTAQEGGLKSNRPEVNIADQIAIRSLVLSKSLGKVGGQE